MQVFKLSPDTGKVSAKLTKGASWRRNERTILSCVRTHAPIASQDRHFPPYSGEADPKEKGIIVFIILYTHF